MDGKMVKQRMMAAQVLLEKKTIDASTISELKTLLSGFHPTLDKSLKRAEAAFLAIDKAGKGDVVELTLVALPDVTHEQKRRKKAILFFLKFWNDLKSEVERVQKEMGDDFAHQSIEKKAGSLGAILGAMKGPLGIITVLALGIAALKMTEVSILVKNIGCAPLLPADTPAISIPGLSIPHQTIDSGTTAVAKLPPLPISVDATAGSTITVSVLGAHYTFQLGSSQVQVIFDGTVVSGTKTEVSLGSRKEHILDIRCGN